MATPPTFVADYEGASWSTTTTPKTTAAFNGSLGDVLAVLQGSANMSATSDTETATSSPAETFTSGTKSSGNAASDVFVTPATAVLSAARTGMTVSTAFSQGSLYPRNMDVLQFTASSGVGATATQVGNGTAAVSLSITTLNDNSAIAYLFADWAATDASTRTHRTVNGFTPSAANGQEVTYFRNTTDYAVVVAYIPDAGTAGSKTVGLTTPSTGDWLGIAVEVRGAAVSAPTGGYFVQEEDGTSTFRLEDDSGALQEEETTFTSYTPSPSDPEGLTDSASVQQTLDRQPADSEGLTDSAVAQMAADRQAADNIGLTDSVSAVTTMPRTGADSLGLTDAASATQALDRQPSDPEALTDSASIQMAAARQVADPLGLTDSAIAELTLPRSAADPLGLTDSATTALAADRQATDSLPLTDAVIAEVTRPRTADDPENLTDVASLTQTMYRSPADAMGLTDSVTVQFTGSGSASVNDPLSLSDAVTVEAVLVRSSGDALGLSDVTVAQLAASRSISDALGLTDAMSLQISLARVPADPLGLSDATHLDRVPATAVEVNALTDQVTVFLERNRPVDDLLGLSDAVQIVMDRQVVIDDAMGLVDSVQADLVTQVLHAMKLSLELDPGRYHLDIAGQGYRLDVDAAGRYRLELE